MAEELLNTQEGLGVEEQKDDKYLTTTSLEEGDSDVYRKELEQELGTLIPTDAKQVYQPLNTDFGLDGEKSPQGETYADYINRYNTLALVKAIREKNAHKTFTSTRKEEDYWDDYYLGGLADPRVAMEVQDVPFEAVYTHIGDGEYGRRYESYLPGVNNEERLAQAQDAVWGRGFKRLGAKTAINVAGGLANIVVGAVSAVAEGGFSALYDNDFSKELYKLNQKVNFALPIYHTQVEKDKNFFQSLSDSSFWADQVFEGASFFFGSMISEGIWAAATMGGSLATAPARMSLRTGAKAALKHSAKKAAREGVKGATKWFRQSPSHILHSFSRASARKKLGTAANNFRFMMTSAGFESGQEAYLALNESVDSYLDAYQKHYGKLPSMEELRQFTTQSTKNSNLIFAGNMALVGYSNLQMFGSLMGLKTGISKSMSRAIGRAFGAGIKTVSKGGKVAYEPLKANLKQKVGRSLYSFLKNPLREGFVEEGGQGVISGTSEQWLDARYNPKALKENYGLMTAMADAFAHTYGTKEGFKEVGLGMLIGMFGAGFTRAASKRNPFSNSFRDSQKYYESLAPELNKASLKLGKAQRSHLRQIVGSNQFHTYIEKASRASKRGDMLGTSVNLDVAYFTKMNLDDKAGNLSESTADFALMLENLSTEELMKEFNITEEQANAYKEAVLADYKYNVSQYKKARNMAQGVDLKGKSGEHYQSALALNIFLGRKAYDRLTELGQEIGELAGLEGGGISNTLMLSLKGERTDLLQERKVLKDELLALEEEYKKITSEIGFYTTKESKVEGVTRLEELKGRQAEVIRELQAKKEALRQLYKTRKAVANLELHPFIVSELLAQREEITEESLEKDFENLQKLDTFLKEMGTRTPLGQRLGFLTEEYAKNIQAFQNFNEAFEGFGRPNFKFKSTQTVDAIVQAYEVANKVLTRGKTVKERGLESTDQAIDKLIEANQEILTDEELATIKTLAKLVSSLQLETTPIKERVNTETAIPVEEKLTEEDEKPLPTSLLENLQEKIDRILRRRAYLENVKPENIDEKLVPTEAEIKEFERLLEDERKGKLTPQKIERLEQLRDKINTWGLLEGTLDSTGVSLADQIESLVYLKAKEKQRSLFDPFFSFLKSIIDIDLFKPTTHKGNFDYLQSYDKALVSKGKDLYRIHNLSLNGLLDILSKDRDITVVHNKQELQRGENGWAVPIKKKAKYIVQLNDIEGGITLSFQIGERGNIVFGEMTRVRLNKFTPVQIYSTNNLYKEYQTVMQRVKVGDKELLVPIDTDFELEAGISMSVEATKNLKQGDQLTLEVTTTSDYNKALMQKYKRANVAQKDEILKEVINTVLIYVKDSNGNVVGVMKAASDLATYKDDVYLQQLIKIREVAAKKLLSEESLKGGVATFDLGLTVNVKVKHEGHPNLNLQVVGGEFVVEGLEFTDETTKKVQNIGFLAGGELLLNEQHKTEKKELNTSFITKLQESTKKNNRRIPVVVFEYRGTNIVYPVRVKEKEGDIVGLFDSIVTDESTSNVAKIKALYDLCTENNININDLRLTLDNFTEANLAEIRKILTTMKAYYNLDNWLSADSDISTVLKEEGLINIDLSSNPFHSPKLSVDITGIKGLPQETSTNETVEEVLPQDIQDEVNNEIEEPC